MEFTFSLSYDYRFSKNRKFVSHNTKILSKEYRAALDEIAWLTKPAAGHFRKAKLWVHILVIKPSDRADAQNFIEAICDGIKEGIGIDDHKFSGSWDWEVDKRNPGIVVRIKQ